MVNKNFEETINHFLDVVSQDKDIDLTTFYHNLETLEITVGEREKIFNSGYNNFDNRIYFVDQQHLQDAIYHELFHCASTKLEGNTSHSGFYVYNDDTKVIHGLGINEGYTEALHQRYFGIGKGYAAERFYIQKLEQIIEPETMKKLYFNSDLQGLITELSKYAPIEAIDHFIYCMDLYTFSSNPNRDNNSYTFEQRQEAITFCSDFIAKCYCYKLEKLNDPQLKQKVLDELNSYNKVISYDNGTEISMNLSKEAALDILEETHLKDDIKFSK